MPRDGSSVDGFVRYVASVARPSWIFFVSPTVIACLDAGVAPAVVDSVWQAATRENATIESVVGAIPVVGEGAAHSFAVVSFTGGDPSASEASAHGASVAGLPAPEPSIAVVVRGTASVDVFSRGGARRFSSGGVQPWLLADFRSVSGLSLGKDAGPTPPSPRVPVGSLPLVTGAVEGENLVWALSNPPRVPAEDGAFETMTIDGGLTLTRSTTYPDPTRAVGGAHNAGRFAFRIRGGQTFLLDAPTVFGRKPQAPRIAESGPARLVTVDSPNGQVSSTHLRLAQEDGFVVVTDLRSTNGTFVTERGRPPRRLGQGESCVVSLGTMIDIGEGNIIEVVSATIDAGDYSTDMTERGSA